ncbi:MAG: HYR domain-containing protein, partial [Verrucomicrobia bacterium]|nr:HYR domain-containing protein [Verrucomicrobiota bacterium]
AGNTASATQTVTVTDAENPTTTAPADVTVSTDAGKSYASGVALGTANTTDNCGVAGTVNDAPAQFPQGNTTVTWTVTDTSGNTATATQVVTVKDTEPPTIIPPADVVVNTDPGANQSGTILTPPVTSDNSGIASVTSDAPAVFPFGSTLVTWTVTDTSGNASTITQTVTVRDAEKPSIVPRQLPTPVSVTPGLCSASGVNLGTPTVSDNCGIKRVVNDAPAVFPKGITIVTWTVTDTSDNTATATQTVTVVDHEDPTITAPAAVVVNADAGKNYASSVTLGSPETTDNCGVASVANNAPETFPQGDTTVTWTVTDTSGNKATATQTVTVADCEKPTITAPEDVLTVSDAGSCNATSVALGNPATADNCDVLSTVNDHQAATFPLGETLVTWTVTDASGNTATAVQKVTVLPSVSVTFLSPLAGQPVANKIRHGQVVPHKVTLASCSGASPPAGVTVKLKVQGIDSADNSVFQEVPEDANGVGSDGTVTSDGIMVLNDGNYQFNLDTSNFGDPNTLASPTKYYRSTVTVVDNATLMVLGTVAVNLETR